MSIKFKRIRTVVNIIKEFDKYDSFRNINIIIYNKHEILLDFDDFRGELSISELKQIVSKMKELEKE